MAISRMNMERQLRAGGGIMTLDEPRQGYFLGKICLLYTSPSPRDGLLSRMPSSA